jgi:hypothetical protein
MVSWMSRRDPWIELAGYERLHDLERRIWYSPVAIGLFLVGLGAAAYTFWSLSHGIVFFSDHLFLGYAIFLAPYGALFCYYFGYRFRRLKCPGCGELMQPYVTDMEEGSWRRFIQAFEIQGRYYRRPYDEDDHRPWVRLQKRVYACQRCNAFVDCSRLHFETCTEDELEQIRQRVGAS